MDIVADKVPKKMKKLAYVEVDKAADKVADKKNYIDINNMRDQVKIIK